MHTFHQLLVCPLWSLVITQTGWWSHALYQTLLGQCANKVKRVCYLATRKYKTTPLRRQICFSFQATSSATVGPVRKVADQMGKWKSQCFSTFKPVAIYTLESRRLEDNYMIFSHLSYQSYLQEGDVSKGLKRTMVVFSQVPLSQPSTDSIFKDWVIYSGNWLPYGFPLRYKPTIGGSSLTPIRSTSCEPRNANSYVDIFIHMLVAIWRCVFLKSYSYRLQASTGYTDIFLCICRVIYTSGKVAQMQVIVQTTKREGPPSPLHL